MIWTENTWLPRLVRVSLQNHSIRHCQHRINSLDRSAMAPTTSTSVASSTPSGDATYERSTLSVVYIVLALAGVGCVGTLLCLLYRFIRNTFFKKRSSLRPLVLSRMHSKNPSLSGSARPVRPAAAVCQPSRKHKVERGQRSKVSKGRQAVGG